MFYDRFKELCDANGTNPTAVLKKLKISTSKGTAWKSGSDPSIKCVILISDFFGISTDYLLGRTDNPNGNTNSFNSNGDNSVQNIGNDNASKRDLELLEKINNLDLIDYAEIITIINEKSKRG